MTEDLIDTIPENKKPEIDISKDDDNYTTIIKIIAAWGEKDKAVAREYLRRVIYLIIVFKISTLRIYEHPDIKKISEKYIRKE